MLKNFLYTFVGMLGLTTLLQSTLWATLDPACMLGVQANNDACVQECQNSRKSPTETFNYENCLVACDDKRIKEESRCQRP